VRVSLARGEYERAQLVLVGGDQETALSVVIELPKHVDTGEAFPRNLIEIRRVDYVKTRKPYYPVTHVGDWPDPLPLAEIIEIPAGKVQPVWVTVGATDTLASGTYEGALTLKDREGRSERLPLKILVRDFTLPKTASLKTAFDLYGTRLEQTYLRELPGGHVWQGRMDQLARRYILEMLKHRLSPIWNADPRQSRFAWEVKEYLEQGLNAFGVGSHGGSFGNNWAVDWLTLQQQMVWYRQAALELALTDLLDQAYVYAYDEPQVNDAHAAQVLAGLKETAPQLKTLLVMHEAPDPERDAQWLKDADILCIRLPAWNTADTEAFRSQGKELWMYVSSPAHPTPSLVIDYPAIAHRVIPWMAWKYGASGLLYWSVNYWTGDPWKDPATFQKDQNGNGFLFYPAVEGPIPSIRLEILRDGIEDYEYFHMLSNLINQASEQPSVSKAELTEAKALLSIPESLIKSARDYTRDWNALLNYRFVGSLPKTAERSHARIG